MDTVTLPGWPDPGNPSPLRTLALLVGAPLVVIALVAVIARVHHAVHGNMGTPEVANQPIWVNGRRIEAATQDESSRAAIDGGYQAVSEGAAARSGSEPDEDTGGAGARW